MTTFYMDLEGGNDANAGTSFALRWKTFATGATAARTAPGDTIRIMASPDETLIGNATWTDLSKTVTLAGAVTQSISDCETAWTASANVTATADTVTFKENTKSAKLVIAAGFTTGLAAYFATGALDLSGYQQVTLWILNSASVAASTLSLRLCSDTVGAVTVDTLAIPAIPTNSTTVWIPITIDKGSALGASIQSVALYADLDPGAVTIQLDNITACKASSSADSLTLNSMIGKVWNLSWVASATYAANDIRIPTTPNRNGYRYKVTAGGGGTAGGSEPTWPQEIGVTVADGALTWTCEGFEDTWYPIQSISGTTVKIDNANSSLATAGRGYSGATETVATYKREPIMPAMMASTGVMLAVKEAGTRAAPIVYSGGWNRTDMSTQTGQTWTSGRNGQTIGIGVTSGSWDWVTLYDFGFTRYSAAYVGGNSERGLRAYNCHFNGNQSTGVTWGQDEVLFDAQGVVMNNNGGNGILFASNGVNQSQLRAVVCHSNLTTGVNFFSSATGRSVHRWRGGSFKNNGTYGITTQAVVWLFGYDIFTSDNATGGVSTAGVFEANFFNSSFAEATPFQTLTADRNQIIRSQRHQRTADNHLITVDGGTIASATDQRHTASGISWKFLPTSTGRGTEYPLRLPVAKIACQAGVAVTVRIWARRNNTNIKGRVMLMGGQVAGAPTDLSVACEPVVDTWTQSDPLAFTPTEDGVVEIIFEVFDGVGTTNSYWVDDLSIA
jgi:hypothetical protein